MTRNKSSWLSALILALILLSLAGPWSLASTPSGLTEPVVVRLYVRDREHLDAVAGSLDIWEAHPEERYVVAAVKPAEYQWLESLGYRMEIDAERTELLGIRAPLDPRFHYFDDNYFNPNDLYLVDFLQNTNASYPDLTELIDIGDAWEGSVGGGYNRDIWVLRITNEDPAYGPIEDKPAFFLFGTIHAREVAIPELVIRYIKLLTTGYQGQGGYDVDPDATWLVNHNVLYALVMQNPDGHAINEQNTSASWRKNVDNDDGCNDQYNWGVDLNRNHSFFWGCCGGSSPAPCDTTYRGPAAGSEPETQVFQAYFATVMLDQNGPNGDDELPPAAPDDATGIFISMHSHSDLVLWPWGVDDHGDPPNMAQLTTIGRKFAYYTDYDPSGSIWYDVDGATDDWTYGKFGVASYTFEVGPGYGDCGGFFPDYECLDGEPGWPRNFWAENRPAFLFAHKIARTPYMTAYGPDTENVVVTPEEVPQGAPVQLTATIADQRYPGDPLQPIDGAEYFLDAPGEDGTGIAMSPSDGSWGDLVEDVEVMADTSSLLPGKHYILVHGQNDDGDWGPFTAVFLTTTAGVEPDAIDLDAWPASIPVVYGQATVTATLSLSDSSPAPGWPVTFTTDLGTVDPPVVYSDLEGHAVTTLYAGDVTGTAQITAHTASLMAGPVQVDFYLPDAPTAGFSSNNPVCIDDVSIFTNTTVYPPEVPVEYLWDLGDGTGTSTETHPVYTYGEAGTFTVTLTASNVGGSDVASGEFTVKPRPDAAFVYSPAYPQPGEMVRFYDTSDGNPMAWDWDFGDGSGATVQNPIHIYATGDTYTVTLRAQNDCGWSELYSEAIAVGEAPTFFIYLPLVTKP
jgi:carboxypeptidase T